MKLDKPLIKTWDNVANNYNNNIPEHEKNNIKELISVLEKNNINKNYSFIELGCGSGHLSGLLAKEGYNVTLLDFSRNALNKSKEFFLYHSLNGDFIEGDIFKLEDLNSQFDVTWNSGVMEHFDDEALIKAMHSIREITKKYFVMIVPNPESFVYLLHRMNLMQKGHWIYGTEYIRYDYEEILNIVGFKLLSKHYLWNAPSISMFKTITKNKKFIKNYEFLLENSFLNSSKSAICYISEIQDYDKNKLFYKGKTREITELIDNYSGFNELNYTPKIPLQQKIKRILKI